MSHHILENWSYTFYIMKKSAVRHLDSGFFYSDCYPLGELKPYVCFYHNYIYCAVSQEKNWCGAYCFLS